MLPLLTAASSFYVDARLPRPPHKRPISSKDDQVCFVNSASSGVGSAAVQLAILHGYRGNHRTFSLLTILLVIGTSSPSNFDLVKSLGASDVFDYRDPDLVQKVKNAAGKKIDFAYDAAATDSSIAASIEILENKGTLMMVRPFIGNLDTKGVNVLPAFGDRVLVVILL